MHLQRPDRKCLGKYVIKIMETAVAVFPKRQLGLLKTRAEAEARADVADPGCHLGVL